METNEKDIEKKIESLAKRSFETKLNLFLFKKVLDGRGAVSEFEKDFYSFKITTLDISEYAAIYYQEIFDHTSPSLRGYSPRYISINIKTLKDEKSDLINKLRGEYLESFKKSLSVDRFRELVGEWEKDGCHYCRVKSSDILFLSDNGFVFKKAENRGYEMEVDRREANKEYEPQNLVPCCYWCNNAKTDEFNDREFLVIADGIRKVWFERLETIGTPKAYEIIKDWNERVMRERRSLSGDRLPT